MDDAQSKKPLPWSARKYSRPHELLKEREREEEEEERKGAKTTSLSLSRTRLSL